MKRRALVLVIVLVGATIGLSLASLAEANFNAVTGFSGRQGFTCSSCHNIPDRGPLGDEEIYPEPATVHLSGLPDAWNAQETYRLDIRVTGGPPALPSPAPQGGFEIEANAGTFRAPDDMLELVDVYTPGAVTYTAAGALVREWAVEWTAPDLETQPEAVTFWLAGMSANGNHVVAAGQGDGGELGDSVDNLTATVQPSPEAMDEWLAVRLLSPVVGGVSPADPFTPITLEGTHQDERATHVGYRIDEGNWGRVATERQWSLQLDGLAPGDHEVWIRSESADRESEPVLVPVTVVDQPEQKPTPLPFVLPLAALALARRRP